MLYFKNRVEAGNELAKKLEKYKGQKNAIVALGDGSVMVAAPIIKEVPALITMLVTEAVALPGESDPVGYVDQNGVFVPNKRLTQSQQEGFNSEYRSYIEQQKFQKFRTMNALYGGSEFFPVSELHDHNIIMVSDGFSSGPLLESLVELLKPIRLKNFIVATPVACVTTMQAIKEHADDVFCLNVAQFYMGVNHYYADNTLPEHQKVLSFLKTSLEDFRAKNQSTEHSHSNQ